MEIIGTMLDLLTLCTIVMVGFYRGWGTLYTEGSMDTPQFDPPFLAPCSIMLTLYLAEGSIVLTPVFHISRATLLFIIFASLKAVPLLDRRAVVKNDQHCFAF